MNAMHSLLDSKSINVAKNIVVILHADSSKQRSRLRSKNASEKKKLEDLVKQHNFTNKLLNETSGDITTTQALAGSFHWIDELDGEGRVPIRTSKVSIIVRFMFL